MEYEATEDIPKEVSAVIAHIRSILEYMKRVEQSLIACQSTKANSCTIRSGISSITDTMRIAVRLSAAFSFKNGDAYLADIHRSLAEFCGITLYLEDLSCLAAQESGSQPNLGGFRIDFSAWVETLWGTFGRFGDSSQVHNRLLSESESMDYDVDEGVPREA
ncbi:MAG: hypothetical protein M1840_000620 [Geoglossum simile]|nr:MAG: hypothetical protein M1840_000620 [Geoglossum simile]